MKRNISLLKSILKNKLKKFQNIPVVKWSKNASLLEFQLKNSGYNDGVGVLDAELPNHNNYKQLAYAQDFITKASLEEFEFSDTKVWKFNEAKALECTGKADYQPPVRSPHSIALIRQKQFGSFTLEVDLQQTGKEYNHQDMCLFFGFQNPSQFYYAHISRMMDDHANNVFIVNNAPRTKISTKTNSGQNWKTGQWHKIRLERNIETGMIRLFFDDMETPVMEAKDTTFGKGAIGFGTFDDSGMVDNIRIWSKDVEEHHIKYFY